MKKNKIKEILKKVGEFFNKPAPIIIVLIAIICFLLLYITSYTKKDKILIGSLNGEKVVINNIHYFTNGDMNYFYATPASYLGEEKVYSFQIGYFVIDEEGNYIEFATKSNTLEKANPLNSIVEEQSSWDFAELDMQEYLFNKDVKNNIDRIHFVIKASTKKDSNEADIVVDEEISITKITK